MLSTIVFKAKSLANLVKLEHTIFALPFALSALLLGAPAGELPRAITVLWVVLAMIGGRTYAMGLNRIADAQIDAKNPRTANREIPAGIVKPYEAWVLTLSALALMTVATWQLPVLCLYLLPVAILVLTLYSYTKRFTSLCHLVLGVALGSSAIGGWIAQTGGWHGGLPILFGFAVACWVCGFDIIYACQDAEFDQANGLFSIPARLGIAKALALSKFFHITTVVALVSFGAWYCVQLGFIGFGFWFGTAITAGMLYYEHTLISPKDLSKINLAFFDINGKISLLMFFLILADKLIHLKTILPLPIVPR
jgi:4-hydroxybenzoate polyprenyltransferase